MSGMTAKTALAAKPWSEYNEFLEKLDSVVRSLGRNFVLLPQTPQLKALHTVIRDRWALSVHLSWRAFISFFTLFIIFKKIIYKFLFFQLQEHMQKRLRFLRWQTGELCPSDLFYLKFESICCLFTLLFTFFVGFGLQIRLVVEEGLNQLPFKECKITTPTGAQYQGCRFEKGNCGVSIVRSGEAMEKVCLSIPFNSFFNPFPDVDLNCN